MSHNGSSASHAGTELDVMRHSAAHVLAKAVQQLYPGSRLGIGPVIENGFYYDIDIPAKLSEDDLPRIEDTMREIVAASEPFVREEWTRHQALEHFSAAADENPYKREIVEALSDDESISFYRTGADWLDLCRGPHVADSSEIGAFKLLSVSGAYWRGDEKRPMLQRIYGTAWQTQDQLDHYLWLIEEARKRDHRKLGRELELFFFDEAAPGQPFWLPKGLRIIHELEALLQHELDSRGYLEISTPSLVKSDLWKQSGHWDFYEQGMFKLEVEEEDYAFKPMNCPESTLVFRFKTRSYRDLPLRLAQTDRLLRNERSGTLNGLLRVRQLTMDDAHIFCRPDQVQDEIRGVLEFQKAIYGVFGMEPRFYLSTRPEKAIGDPAVWDVAEADLKAALELNGLAYEVKAGRRRLLWSEDRRRHPGCAWSSLAAEHDPARLSDAGALQARVRRRGRPRASAGDDSPRHLWHLRALHGGAHRALRGRVSTLAGARPGSGGADCRSPSRVRRVSVRQAARGWLPSRGRRPAREDAGQDPRCAGPASAVHAGGRRPRPAGRHGLRPRTPPGRPRRAAPGGFLEASGGPTRRTNVAASSVILRGCGSFSFSSQ